MARTSVYVCSVCGRETGSWMGQCSGCDEWGTLTEEPRRGRARESISGSDVAAEPVPLGAVLPDEAARVTVGIEEFDRVLGGGIVPGSVVLIGGSPGIGKSTLLNQALGRLAAAGRRTLYVTAEESAAQVRLRAERLGPDALRVPLLAQTDLDCVVATLEREAPDVCVIDSVQTLCASSLASCAGSVSQVREVAARILRVAKARRMAALLVGHVTKDGSLAGPRVLEHMVDAVLQFEGERERTYRLLRAQKNRFGPTNELGVFDMEEGGLVGVADASARFVEGAATSSGSCVCGAMEGSRPLLVEVQALVAPTDAVSPKRVSQGVGGNRLNLILAVLARHANLPLGRFDVFVNVVGGIEIDEPGADLAVALALASAAMDRPLSVGDGEARRPLAAFGEVGLTGELRLVANMDRRLVEIARFGLPMTILPAGGGCVDGAEACGSVAEALRAALPRSREAVAG